MQPISYLIISHSQFDQSISFTGGGPSGTIPL